MVLLTVVTTLASGMVWQQWKAVQVEAAERSRAQSGWILQGALDWSRLILREDARSGRPTSLNEPWATPLAEARLSTFLAADRNNNTDTGPEAFLSGSISDAQARYNLRNLVVASNSALPPAELAALLAAQNARLQRLCGSAGLGADIAALLATGLAASAGVDASAPLAPLQMADLAWLGLDAASIERLATVAVLLPVSTPLNLNTASREVLAAVIPGLDLGGADRLVQARTRKPFATVGDASAVLGASPVLDATLVDVKSSFFEVRGRLRLDDRVLEEQTLIQRKGGLEVVAIQHLRQAGLSPASR